MQNNRRTDQAAGADVEAVEHCYRLGYQAARHMSGGFRVNLQAMQYEPVEPLADHEFAAWTEGFRAGYLDRRAAGEPTA